MSSFRPLQKAILSKEQLEAFQASSTHASITSYVEVLNNSVVGVKLTDELVTSRVRRLAFAIHFTEISRPRPH
jgi:serine/threonine-protein phosphatase 2A activator